MFLFAISFITYCFKKLLIYKSFAEIGEREQTMENNTSNGETNKQNIDHEVNVTEAEVNHDSQEPIALKRNVVTEEQNQETEKGDHKTDDQKLVNGNGAEEKESAEQESTEPANESVTQPEANEQVVPPQNEDAEEPEIQTSETFMKIEEKKVIERLSRVVDTELTLQLSDNKEGKDSKEEASDDIDKREDTTDKDSHEESKDEPNEVTQNGEDIEAKPHESNTFSAIGENAGQNDVNTEEDESIGKDLKTGYSISEPQANDEDNNVTFRSVEENNVNENTDDQKSSSVDEQETKRESSEPEVVGVVKQNGNRCDENQNEEEQDEEGEDHFQENIQFKSTLKMWSTGKKDESDAKKNSRDKFKTLRQIKKGNTRSLMEKFQIPK